MAHTMKKFSAGGAQGRYNRRMADIEKDYAKAMARKTGKAAEVAEAKRQQRIADAKDDLAKRTGADRSATRAAERAAERNLKMTRKYGAPKAVTTEASVSEPKIGNVLAPIKSGLSTPAKKAPAKPAAKPSAADIKRNKFFQDSLAKSNFKAVGDAANARQKAKIGASNAPSDQGFSSKSKVLGASKNLKTNRSGTSAALLAPKGSSSRSGSFGDLFKTSDSFKASQERKYGKRAPTISGTDTNAFFTYGKAAEEKNAANKAKGGKIKKYAAGGVTKEMPSSKAMGSLGMAKGGKAKMKPAAKGKAKGNPFAATKFGAAMMKKSADTKGRAMPKFAKGGSIDGCAVRGKTKAKRVTMKRGGSC